MAVYKVEKSKVVMLIKKKSTEILNLLKYPMSLEIFNIHIL
jgi:hypothetical protein